MAQFIQWLNSSQIPDLRLFIGVFLIASLTSACQPASKKPSVSKPPLTKEFTSCTDPRPEMCTQEYLSVCASKDTGIRCVTTPCPSTEDVPYSNACSACADPKVHGYTSSACE